MTTSGLKHLLAYTDIAAHFYAENAWSSSQNMGIISTWKFWVLTGQEQIRYI